MNQDNKIIAEEKKILAEEKQILTEIKKEEKLILGIERKIVVTASLITLTAVAVVVGFIYFRASAQRIYIEKSSINAPTINLSATTPGVLEETFVHEGDLVSADTPVARVGNELIKSKDSGLITKVVDNKGKLMAAGEPVVAMIDPNELKVEGKIAEDKGLANISVGQSAMFTVDAYGSKKYFGVVDEISPVSLESGVVFNISDKREIKEFLIKVRFDNGAYAELKSGMSAKMWIYKI